MSDDAIRAQPGVPASEGSYVAALTTAKPAIQAARTRSVLAANNELISLYWQLGTLILERQRVDGWGTKVVERFSADLRAAFPEMKGLSRTNLMYMRALAAAWPDPEICPTTRGTIAVGTHPGAPRQARRPRRAGVVRPSRHRARLVPTRAGEPDHVAAAPPRRRRAIELR